MRVVVDNLKLGDIKGCDRSKEKGYPMRGNGKSYFFFLFLKGFEVGLWGV